MARPERHPEAAAVQGIIVEIAIPPGKVEELHIVSCNYDTPTRRRPGFTAEDW